MTELARTSAADRRLFRSVDFAPLPNQSLIAEALEGWRRARGSSLAPNASGLLREEPAHIRAGTFLAERAGDEYLLSRVGTQARLLIDGTADAGRLAELDNRRTAVRLRHLFRLALERGEPVDVRFVDGREEIEALAAPVRLPGDRAGLFCAIAKRPRAVIAVP